MPESYESPWGVGPLPASIMLVGEAWGETEEREGRPFCGISGEELSRYLSWVRIDRSECYVTNLCNERPPGNADPTPEMIARHEPRLRAELLAVRPKYVVTLGRYSTRWFLPHLPARKLMEREWGLGHTVRICGACGSPCDTSGFCPCLPDADSCFDVCVVPCHHPAYGLYQPDDQILIQEALEGRMGLTWGLRRIIDGELPPHPPIDQYPHPQYRELTDADNVDLIRLLGTTSVIAVDTEGSARNPWCLSFSTAPGTGYVIRATESQTLATFATWLTDTDPLVVMHYAAHDLEVLAAMGIIVTRFADTMLGAYLLGRMFPQALKLLAYRLHGMHMRDYDDLTADVDRRLAVEYLERVLHEGRCSECRGRGLVVTSHRLKNGKLRRSAAKCDACEGDGTSWPVPRPLPIWEQGKLRMWQPSPVGARARRILADVRAGKVNREGEPTDPRARWLDADPPEAIAAVTHALGPMPVATLDMVPRSEAIDYACADADATLRTWLLLDPLIDTWGLRDVYNVDLGVIPLLVEMQQAGMQVDTDYFRELSAEWRAEMARLRHRIQQMVGYYVSPSSPKQVANLLFEKLRLPPVRQTKSKTGESTDDKVLEQLAITTKHPVIPLIQRHRELHKLDGTYATPLSLIDSPTGRVYMEFRYTRTDTGRLSSAKPKSGVDKRNYIQGQNIPTRTDEGKRIRKGLVARPGYYIGSWDLSQIEWRCMAHLSQDANLLRVFREGHDLHKMTASLIWKIPIEEVSREQRQSAKNIGFGMGYKITWRGLQQQFAQRGIEISKQEAQAFIDAFMAAYPGISRFWERTFTQARRDGYVRSVSGRIRWVVAIRSKAAWVREEAERKAGNFPVQELAAYIMKLIMIEVGKRLPALRRRGFDVRCLLPIHDSLEFEFPVGLEEVLDPMMRRIMSSTVELSVPLTGEGTWATNWAGCKLD